MKKYIDYIEDEERCTKEDLIAVVNQMSDKLNYVLNLIYNSPMSVDDYLYDDLDR